MDRLLEQLAELISLDVDTTNKILVSLLVILGIGAMRLIALRLIYRRTDDVRVRYNWRKGTTGSRGFSHSLLTWDCSLPVWQ